MPARKSLKPLSSRTRPFQESVIREMTRLSEKIGGVNLAQGLPDFAPPAAITKALAAHDAVVVVTTNPIDGMPLPGCAVADRWGQMQWVTAAQRIAELPSPREIAAWLRFVEIQCPECDGEVH